MYLVAGLNPSSPTLRAHINCCLSNSSATHTICPHLPLDPTPHGTDCPSIRKSHFLLDLTNQLPIQIAMPTSTTTGKALLLTTEFLLLSTMLQSSLHYSFQIYCIYSHPSIPSPLCLPRELSKEAPPHCAGLGWHSCYISIPKWDYGLRPLLDIRNMNSCINTKHFQMITIQSNLHLL